MDLDALIAELAQFASERGLASRMVAYGGDPEQTAELRLPVGEGPHPVAVILHGGFWRAPFTSSIMQAVAVDLAEHGWASWNVEYRRIGCGGGVPETLDDVAAAIGFLERLDAPIEPASVVVVGHSAGGQLALWAADLPEVAAVVSLAGVCDLRGAARDGIGAGATVEFLGGTALERPDAYAAADPLSRAPAGARITLVHGDADDRVPVRQSRAYLRAAGPDCELLELVGVGHFALIDPRSDAWVQVRSRLSARLMPDGSCPSGIAVGPRWGQSAG